MEMQDEMARVLKENALLKKSIAEKESLHTSDQDDAKGARAETAPDNNVNKASDLNQTQNSSNSTAMEKKDEEKAKECVFEKLPQAPEFKYWKFAKSCGWCLKSTTKSIRLVLPNRCCHQT